MAATTIKIFVSCLFCLFVLIKTSEAQRQSITDHLVKNCQGFEKKKVDEGYRCNSEVIDHVHDYAESIKAPGYDGDMVEDYLNKANARDLCYAKGPTVKRVESACAAMEMVCDVTNPKVVDICSKVKPIVPAPPQEPTPAVATEPPTTAATTPAFLG